MIWHGKRTAGFWKDIYNWLRPGHAHWGGGGFYWGIAGSALNTLTLAHRVLLGQKPASSVETAGILWSDFNLYYESEFRFRIGPKPPGRFLGGIF